MKTNDLRRVRVYCIHQWWTVVSAWIAEWRRRRYGDGTVPVTTSATLAVSTSRWTDTVDHSSNPRGNRWVILPF